MENKEIKICDKCEGLGQIQVMVSICDSDFQICSYCNGSGRIVVTTITKPFIKKEGWV